MQGIFVEYGITTDDEVTAVRNGGFGSTTKQCGLSGRKERYFTGKILQSTVSFYSAKEVSLSVSEEVSSVSG